jgi:predicted amidohydrolase YtcJ
MKADTLFINGRIYDGLHPKPKKYLAIKGSKILAAGSGNPKPFIGNRTNVLDLHGCAVTPGLIDSHVHFLDYAFSLSRVKLEKCKNEAEVILTLKEYSARAKSGEWILGRGWHVRQFGGFPNKKLLDEIFPNNPVILNSHDEHFRWLNSKAIKAAGLTDNTRVDGGHVGRNDDGSLDGLLGENAVMLVRDFIQSPDESHRKQNLLRAQTKFHEMGITGFHSTDANRAFADLQDLNSESKLKLRVFHSIPLRQLEDAIQIGLKSGLGDEWFRVGFVKIFTDGSLGSRTASMLEPYDEAGGFGIQTIDEKELDEKVSLALQNGIALGIHAIGDKANRQVLNAFEKSMQFLNVPKARSRIEHAQLLHPDDIARFQKIGILASMQPFHAISDRDIAEQFWGKRARYSYAWRSLLDSGAHLIFGSDAPVEDPDPLPGLHAAVHREKWDDQSETISPHEALVAYTSAPAYASGELANRGTLERNKLADLTFFSEDPIATAFHGIQVIGTMINGEFVFGSFK